MNAPEREMLLTYSWMNSSTEPNSWLIVTRSSRGTSFLRAFSIAFLRFAPVLRSIVRPVLGGLLLSSARAVRPLLGRLLADDLVLLHMVARARRHENVLLEPLLHVLH